MQFAPTAAIVVHSLVDIEEAVISTLKGEDGLLVESCVFKATRPSVSRYDTQGREFLNVQGPLDASWQITGRQIARRGLADYHPGRKLSEMGLMLAQSEFIPFQVGTTLEENKNGAALYIYENPTLTMPAGDLPGIDFSVRVVFAEEDTFNYPSTGYEPPDLPTQYVDLPTQAAAEVIDAYKTVLLKDIFQTSSLFNQNPVTATLYNGDPSTGGSIVQGPLDLTAWTDFDEPALDYQTRARNQSIILWNDVNSYNDTATHIRFERNSILLKDITLAAPLVVPAYFGVRAPVGALGLMLTWPGDGDVTFANGWSLSRNVARYAFGGARSATITSEYLDIEWWDGDPAAGGTSVGILENVAALPASGTIGFTVAGLTMTPGGYVASYTGSTNASYVVIRGHNSFAFLKEQYLNNENPHFLNTVPPALVLNLAATPDP